MSEPPCESCDLVSDLKRVYHTKTHGPSTSKSLWTRFSSFTSGNPEGTCSTAHKCCNTTTLWSIKTNFLRGTSYKMFQCRTKQFGLVVACNSSEGFFGNKANRTLHPVLLPQYLAVVVKGTSRENLVQKSLFIGELWAFSLSKHQKSILSILHLLNFANSL